MSARTREDGRPDTGFMVDIVRDNTKFLAETRLGQAQIVAAIGGVDGRMASLEGLTRTSDGRLERLVELSEQRNRREELDYQARLEREKASQDALHRRTDAELAAKERSWAWLRERIGDKVLVPLASGASGFVLAWLALRFGAPTQTVNVEASQPAPVTAPAPAPAPEPVPVPAPEPAEPPPARVRDDLMEFEP